MARLTVLVVVCLVCFSALVQGGVVKDKARELLRRLLHKEVSPAKEKREVSWVEIIKNEDELMGTCTGTCGETGTLYNKFGCQVVNSCGMSSKGWDRGFVRCDYCKCNCKKEVGTQKTSWSWMDTNESDMYGTCTGTCGKSGLVRTNYAGCQEIRDCKWARNGWTRGFVRCDYCHCKCVKIQVLKEYVLSDVRYDLPNRKIIEAKPDTITSVVVKNQGGTSQTQHHTITGEWTEANSWSVSAGLEIGTSMTVSTGVPKIGELEASYHTTATFGTEVGGSTSTTRSHKMTIDILVPAHTQKEIKMVGTKVKAEVSFTATITTKYTDGTESKEKTSGTWQGVSVTQYHIIYGPDIRI